MTNLKPIRSTQKLPEYGDCLFALQTDEPCKGKRGLFGIFAHGSTPTLLRHCLPYLTVGVGQVAVMSRKAPESCPDCFFTMKSDRIVLISLFSEATHI